MGKKKKTRVSTTAEPSSGGLGGLGDLLSAAGLQASAEPAPTPTAAPVDAPSGLTVPKKVSLNHSRKGRGGRTVTLVRGLPAGELDAWAKALRRALGCGASVDGDLVVLQGDLRERAGTWFEDQGVRKVSR